MKKDKESYNLPNSYFDDFQDRLHTQIALQEVLGSARDAGFKVPEGYFEALSRKLTNIPSQQESAPKIISLTSKKWIWPSMGVAAAVLLFFGIYTGNSELSAGSLEAEEIASYLDSESHYLYTQDIAALFTDEELNTIILNESDHPEDELINYLDTYANPYDLLIE